MHSAKKNILQRIRTALQQKEEKPFPDISNTFSLFQNNQHALKDLFIKMFTKLDGQLIFCESKKELNENLEKLIITKGWTKLYCPTQLLVKEIDSSSISLMKTNTAAEADVGITDCECLVARTGTVVLSAAQDSGRTLPVYSPVHVVISSVDQIVNDINDAIQLIKKKHPKKMPSAIFFASGPSRTADIEKKLVLGVHGPKEIYLLLLGGEYYNKQNTNI